MCDWFSRVITYGHNDVGIKNVVVGAVGIIMSFRASHNWPLLLLGLLENICSLLCVGITLRGLRKSQPRVSWLSRRFISITTVDRATTICHSSSVNLGRLVVSFGYRSLHRTSCGFLWLRILLLAALFYQSSWLQTSTGCSREWDGGRSPGWDSHATYRPDAAFSVSP